MSDTAFESLGLQVELNYTKALGQVGAFQQAVDQMLKNSGSSLGGLDAHLSTSLTGFKGLVNELNLLHAKLSTTAADFRTATQDMNKMSRATEDLGDSVEKLSNKETRAARMRKQNAEYELKTLEQKRVIYEKIAAFSAGRPLASLNKAESRTLERAYGTQALGDYSKLEATTGSAGMAAMLRNQQMAQYRQIQMEQDQQVKLHQIQGAAAYRRTQLEQDQQVKLHQIRGAEAYRRVQMEQAQEAKLYQIQGAAAYRRTQLEQAQEVKLHQIRGAEAYRRVQMEQAQEVKLYQIQGAAAYRRTRLEQDQQVKLREIASAGRKQAAAEALADARFAELSERARITRLNTIRRVLNGQSVGQLDGETQARLRGSFGNAALTQAMANPALQQYQVAAAGRAQAAIAKDGESRKRLLDAERAKVLQNRDAYREMHSAARGLAGGSGMLWLTYGAMLPMAIGAATVGSAAAMVGKGSAFEENMAFVRELSADTAPSLAALQQQVDSIGESLLSMGEKGRFGAVELSASLRTLSQAGYNSNQASQMLPSVTNLATIGETTPDQAALTIAGTLSAFNMGADQSDRIADVLGAAAAASQTSVSQIMESMKQASSVAQDYGASLEETATVLTLLAKRNITGSAAGTAFRNMLVDLAGRTTKSKKALQELGVSLYDDVTGRARQTKDVLLDLMRVMSNMNQLERNTFAKRIFDERGLKAFSAVMGTGQGGFNETLSQLSQAGDNGGFASRMAGNLNQTTQALGLQVLNTFTSQMIRGFAEAEGSVKSFLKEAQKFADSADLKDLVSDLATGLARVAEAAAASAPYLGLVVKSMIALGAGKLVVSSFLLAGSAATSFRLALAAIPAQAAGATISMAMVSGAATTTAVASSGAAVAAGRLTASLAVLRTIGLGPLGIALAAGTAAYLLFADSAEEAAARAKEPLEAMNFSQFASEANDAYRRVKENANQTFAELTGAAGNYSQKQAKSLQDVVDNTSRGLKALEEMKKTAANGDTVRLQAQLDESNSYLQAQMEQAAKYHSGSAEDAKKLTDFYAQLAELRYQNEVAAMDLMVQRSAEAANKMIKDAVDVGTSWRDAWKVMTDFSAFKKGEWSEDPLTALGKASKSRGNAELSQKTHNLANKVYNSAMTGQTVSDDDLMQLKQMDMFFKDMSAATKERVKIAISAAQAQNKHLTQQTAKASATNVLGVKLSSDKPADPSRSGGGRVPSADYQAAKKTADLAKQDLKNFQEMLGIRKALGDYLSQELYDREAALKRSQLQAEFEVQREQIERNIATALKEKNDNAAKTGRDQLEVLKAQYASEQLVLDLKTQQEAHTRRIEELSRSTNAQLEARTAQLAEIRDYYRGVTGETVEQWRANAQTLMVAKAQLDLNKQMEGMNPADTAQRALVLEQARLNLAQRIYDLNRRTFESNSRDVTSFTGAVNDFYTELEYQIDDLHKAAESIPRAAAKGLVQGAQAGFNNFFQFLKNPGAYKEQNGGQGYGGRQFLADTLSGVYDQMTSAMAKQATEGFTKSITGALGPLLNKSALDDPLEVAKQEANRLQAEANLTQQQLITATQNLTTALSNPAGGPGSALPGPVGADKFGPAQAGAALGESVPKVEGMTAALKEARSAANTTGTSMATMASKALSGFSFMQMGMMSLMSGTKQGIKEFVAFTIAELLKLWLIQQLVGMAASAATTPAPSSGLSNGGVDIGSPDFQPSWQYRSEGGLITGPGTSTSDSIPTYLSDKEYVVNAAAVRRYGVAFFDQVNAQKLATGGLVGGGSSRVVGGGGGRDSLELTMNFNFKEEKSNAKDNDNSGGIDQRAMQNAVRSEVRAVLAQELRQGGMLRARN